MQYTIKYPTKNGERITHSFEGVGIIGSEFDVHHLIVPVRNRIPIKGTINPS